MKTGFYNINSLSTVKLKQFFREAVMLSYDTHVELDCGVRKRTDDRTIGSMVNKCSSSYHNVCIDRSVQHDKEKYAEIGYTIIGGESPSYFLYIYLTLDNLKKLTDKYGLIDQEH